MFDSFLTSRTVACQAPLSVGFSRQEYLSELLFPSLRDLPNPGIEPVSPAWQVDSLPLSPWGSPHFPLGKVNGANVHSPPTECSVSPHVISRDGHLLIGRRV